MKEISQNRPIKVRLVRGCLCSLLLLGPLTNPSVAQTISQSESQNQSANNWRDRLARFFDPEPPLPTSQGGSRGSFCMISPGMTFDRGMTELWNQRPNFIWTGRIGKIVVKEVGSREPLWQQTIPIGFATDNALDLKALRYSGPALEADKQYEWQAFERASDSSPQLLRRFSTLPSNRRGPITRSWLQEQVLLVQADATVGEQALQQSKFWLNNELSADFYQSLFMAVMRGHLEGEAVAIVDGIVKKQCGD